MRNLARWILPLLLICGAGVCVAQSTNSGDIRGIVTDSSGALVPGVVVTVLNVRYWRIEGLHHQSRWTIRYVLDRGRVLQDHLHLDGFEQLVRGPITLQVGITTVNGQLKVGSASEQVTVTTDVPLLQTESGEHTVTWDAQTMDSMPEVAAIAGEDWGNQIVMLPGMAGSPTAAYGVTGMQQWGSANGSLPYNNILEDGASTRWGEA